MHYKIATVKLCDIKLLQLHPQKIGILLFSDSQNNTKASRKWDLLSGQRLLSYSKIPMSTEPDLTTLSVNEVVIKV
jgi:hypothetical protein